MYLYFTVHRYASYLKSKYSKIRLVKSDKCPPTNFSEVFINLALVKKKNPAETDMFSFLQGDIDKRQDLIEMDNILEANDEARLVVVEGAPGIGKSTLAWELCRQWPTLESLKRFSLVVHHKLREEEVQSAVDISDLFPCKDDPGLSKRVAKEVIDEFGKDVLFVFDGFDELSGNQRKSVNSLVMKVIARESLPNATVVLTSRPSAAADLHSTCGPAISKCIEILGFSQTNINDYIKGVFGKTSNHLASFNAYLTANPVVKEIMYNPFNCAMVVKDYYKATCNPAPPTQTDLYTELTLCLLLRYLSTTRNPLAKKPLKTLKDLYNSDLYQQVMKVGKLAFEAKLENKVIFKKLPEGCSDLGLLVEHRALVIGEESTTYNFFHLTLQEYMSALYISHPPTDQNAADKQRALFSEHNSYGSTSMDVVWRFVAGLTNFQNIGWKEFKKVKRRRLKRIDKDLKVEKDKYECDVEENKYEYEVEDNAVEVGPFLLQCLYEAQDVRSCESVFSQHRVHGFVYGDGLHALGYCISVCKNRWNVYIQHMPQDGLETLSHGMKSVDYCGGSIDKLDLFGSQGIMNEGEQIPHQILRHIKSLTLIECDINLRGFENLADYIPHLHSLTSLDISDNQGGDGSLVKLLKALRKHGKLQTLYMQRVVIGMDDLTALADLVQPSSSLRELDVGGCNLSSNVEQQLVRTVLAPSSLERYLVRTRSLECIVYL